jgi:hypothetical protein
MVIIDDEEDIASAEAIERRGEPRGVFPGLKARIMAGPGSGADYDVVEASRVGFFMRVPKPDSLALGALISMQLEHQGRLVTIEGEVVRKEIDPRTGMAVRIAAFADEDAEANYSAILGVH